MAKNKSVTKKTEEVLQETAPDGVVPESIPVEEVKKEVDLTKLPNGVIQNTPNTPLQ